MAKRQDTQLVNYKPERGDYQEKSKSYILGKIRIAEQVGKLAEQVVPLYQRDTNTIDHMVNLFTSKHELGIPDDKRYVMFDAKSAKPADIIMRVMGMLSSPIKFRYVAPFGSPGDDDDADEIEAHLNAYPGWLFRKYKTRWDIQNRFWQILGGRSYLRQSYLPAYWDKTIQRRKTGEEDADYNGRVDGYRAYAGPPVFVEQHDPRMVFPITTAQGPQAHILRFKVQRFEADEAFMRVGKKVTFEKGGAVSNVEELSKLPGQEFPDQSDEAMTSSVTYYEYLDETMCYYVIGDQLVHQYAHNGGIKIFPAYGLQTGFKEYHLATLGLLWAVRNELPQYDFMRTLWVQKAYLDVFPQLFAQLGEKDDPISDEKGNPKDWTIEPMTVKQIRGTLVNALKDASSGMDFRAAVDMFAQDIDAATLSNLARGQAGAQQPGYSINQLMQSLRTMWKPIIESAELQASELGEHYLWINKNLVKTPTTLYASVDEGETGRTRGSYLTLKTDKIHPYCRVEAELNPDLPIDRQGNMMAWANLHERGHATWEELTREGFGKTNPVARRKQVMTDLALRAFLPKAIEDGMALGRVRLTNKIIETQGLKDVNEVFSLDVQALKEARAGQPAQAPAAGGAAAMPPAVGTPTGGPPGELGKDPPQPAPTFGANPSDSSPAYRGP